MIGTTSGSSWSPSPPARPWAISGKTREKRGGGAVQGESAFLKVDSSASGGGIGQVLGREPSPEFAAEVLEQFDELLHQLDDALLREVALLKFEGYTNEEVARKMDCAPARSSGNSCGFAGHGRSSSNREQQPDQRVGR